MTNACPAKAGVPRRTLRSVVLCTFTFAMALLFVPRIELHAATLTIDQLEDIDFGETLPTSRRLRQRTQFCVSMEPAGFYQIRAIGSGSGGDFTLATSSGALDQIRYRVRVRNRELQPGIAASGFRARPPRPNGQCLQQRLVVIIDTSQLASAAGGTYQGSLALTVAPE